MFYFSDSKFMVCFVCITLSSYVIIHSLVCLSIYCQWKEWFSGLPSPLKKGAVISSITQSGGHGATLGLWRSCTTATESLVKAEKLRCRDRELSQGNLGLFSEVNGSAVKKNLRIWGSTRDGLQTYFPYDHPLCGCYDLVPQESLLSKIHMKCSRWNFHLFWAWTPSEPFSGVSMHRLAGPRPRPRCPC